MKKYSTDVLVVGGGATGTGILRDLAMRGIQSILVEKRDLSHGTTGRYHGLLHSGGRYVVKDLQAAQECIAENYILRHIMPFCIEDTGGYFVTTPWDDTAYSDRFLKGCQEAKIPVEEVSIARMLSEEPHLNPQITRCFRVPDASADSFLASESNAASARQYGAEVLPYHEVRKLVRNQDRILGASCFDLVAGEEVEIMAELVINASGAWAGKIAASAGLKVEIKPGKGTMVAVNHRIVNTVINRCKLPADGDILVPAHTVAVIGTTDVQVRDPDHFAIEPWEIQLMLDEGEKLVPGFKRLRMLRAWAGVRPLFHETAAGETGTSRDITRAYVLLDHEVRDGVTGLLTITSGKWTTYRMMAEATVNKACQKLGIQKPCRTHLEPLPSPSDSSHPGYHWLGARLAEIEKESSYGSLICECELATEKEIQRAIQAGAQTIDDIRRETRLGMGPCQGGFCTFRTAGMLHQNRSLPVEATNAALRDFLQERWKGLLPVLWGQQLRQARLDELIYLDVLNIADAPGPENSPLGPEKYAPPEERPSPSASISQAEPAVMDHPPSPTSFALDTVVIGAGLAGLATTWWLSRYGKRVRCISKGWGSLFWASGCIDVLGRARGTPAAPVSHLRETLEDLIQENPTHPYALVGLVNLESALAAFQDLCAQSGYPLDAADSNDPLAENWLLPTALGTLRATCLAPTTMTSGDCRTKHPLLLVGFAGYADFYPHLAAANLTAQGIEARAVVLELDRIKQHRMPTSRILAEFFNDPTFRSEVVIELKNLISNSNQPGLRIGFPAVLGTEPDIKVWQALQEALGFPIFEVPGLPPSIPGIRLHKILVQAVENNRGRVFDGMEALGAEVSGDRILRVWSESAARNKYHAARTFVLATGGILGGGFMLDSDQNLKASVFDLPIENIFQADHPAWLDDHFFQPQGHPIFYAGLQVDHDFRPLRRDGQAVFENLFAIGSTLRGADPVREASLEGIALASAWQATQTLADSLPDPLPTSGPVASQ